MTQEGIADVLIHMGFPLDKLGRNVDTVAELYRLTEGDPLLVRLYVDDLWARGQEASRLRSKDLRDIEPGYQGYFKRWWGDQRALWGTAAPLKERAVQEVLNLLACALGPLTQADLLALTGPEVGLNPWTLEEALNPIARFVVGDRQRGYALAHPKLGEYFREQVLLAQAEQVARRFLAWGQEILDELEQGTLPPEKTPTYLRQYLSVHQWQLKDLSALSRILESPAWYAASTEWDPSGRLFAGDVERALDLAQTRVLEQGRIHTLPRVVAWSLLYATLRSRATNVPVKALEAMVLLGEADSALRYAALITDPAKRCKAYRCIGDRLFELGQRERARKVVGEALAVTQVVGGRKHRIRLLTDVAKTLAQIGEETRAQKELEKILVAAEALGNKESYVKTLVAVAKVLIWVEKVQARKVLINALAVAKSVKGEISRARALTAVAQGLTEVEDVDVARTVLHQALKAAWTIRDEASRDRILTEIAQALVHIGEGDQAQDVAKKIKDPNVQALALTQIVHYLVEAGKQESARQVLSLALETINDVENGRFRAEALATVAPDLAKVEGVNKALQTLNQALKVAQRIKKYEVYRTWALIAVVRGLVKMQRFNCAHRVLAQAQETALKIRDDASRADVLSVIVHELVALDDIQGAQNALNKSLEAVQSIRKKASLFHALFVVAKSLAEIEKWELALKAAQSIRDEDFRSLALAVVVRNVVQRAKEEQTRRILEHALKAVQSIENNAFRNTALANIAGSLVAVEDWSGRLGWAREVVRDISDERYLSIALYAIVYGLTKIRDRADRARLDQALEMAQDIKDEDYQIKALCVVAESLAEVGEKGQAYKVLCLALGIARNMGHIGNTQLVQDRALATVAVGLAGIKDSKSLVQALKVAHDIKDETFQIWTLSVVAWNLAEAGEENQAYQVLDQAVEMAQGIPQRSVQGRALTGVARSLAAMRTQRGLDRALAVARNIKDEDCRNEALAFVAGSLAEKNRGKLNSVLEIAQAVEGNRPLASGLAGIARALAQEGETTQARHMLQRALQVARAIEDEWSRSHILVEVALALNQAGETVQAREVLKEALAAVQLIEYDQMRIHILTDIAPILAQVTELGNVESARLTAIAFQQARQRGRDEVWATIGAFAPVLGKLGVLPETWERIQRVEQVAAGPNDPPD